MIGNFKTFHIRSFYGRTLTKVELTEYVLQVYFSDHDRLDIEEYWEYVDKEERIIDRQMSSTLRKKSLIEDLVGQKLERAEHLLGSFYLRFEGGRALKISILNDKYTTSLSNHKAFGDNKAGEGQCLDEWDSQIADADRRVYGESKEDWLTKLIGFVFIVLLLIIIIVYGNYRP